MAQEAFSDILQWLEKKALAVRDIEAQAHDALHQKHDEFAYRQAMENKAELLSKLAQEAATLMYALPEKERGTISDTLTRFSKSAETALRIGSVFYMSALLYPEEHPEDGKNDLEEFIAEVRTMAE